MKKDKNAVSENINTIEEDFNQILTSAEVVFDDAIKGKNKKRKKPKKVYQKTTFKHKMKVLGVLALLGMFTGCGLGVWYFNTALKSNVDYSAIDITTLYGNVDNVFGEMGLSKEKEWVAKAQEKGLTPNSPGLSAIDNILLCEYNAQNATSYTMIGTGTVTAMGVPQKIYSAKKFNGTAYTFESISAGVLTVATCDYMTTAKDKVTTYQGKNIKEDNSGADWGDATTVDKATFENTVGVLPDSVSPYIISDATKETESEITYNAESETYTFTITLKPIESVMLYYKQVRRSGGLEANPEFSSISITFTINKDWQFVSSSIVEKYKAVKFGMPVSCGGTLDTNYTFNQEVTLPV